MKHLDFIIWDILCLWLSLFLAYYIRHHIINIFQRALYMNMLFVITLIDLLVVIFNQSFKDVLRRRPAVEFGETVRHVVIVILCSVLYLFAVQESLDYSRLVLLYTALIYLFLSYLIRMIWKSYLLKRFPEQAHSSMLVITTHERAASVIGDIQESLLNRYYISGLCLLDGSYIGEMVKGIPVVADSQNILEYSRLEWVDEVFINMPDEEQVPVKMIDHFIEMGIVVHLKLLEYQQALGKKQLIQDFGVFTVLTSSINNASALKYFIKRVADIVGGIIGCMITLLLTLVIGPAIYIKSPGPIFFKQVRIGKNGKKFNMYKFRSMYLDAEERKAELEEQNRVKDGMMFKLDFDPRIIGSKKLEDGTCKKGIGNYIRDLSLDEFPQFFNVLKGDMSLVGTRPPTVDEWEKYKLHHRVRLAMKPGITGMWQVSGRSEITDFEEVVRLDKEYIRNWSLGLDLKILAKTVVVVITRKGSM